MRAELCTDHPEWGNFEQWDEEFKKRGGAAHIIERVQAGEARKMAYLDAVYLAKCQASPMFCVSRAFTMRARVSTRAEPDFSLASHPKGWCRAYLSLTTLG